MIYGTSTSSFPDDGYGCSTDNPPTAYELIDQKLSLKDERKIADDLREFKRTLAGEYFHCGQWDEEFWDAWDEKINELI